MTAVIDYRKVSTGAVRMEVARAATEESSAPPLDEYRVPPNRLTDAMRMHTFNRIIADSEISDLYLSGSGEPVLVPNIADMIRDATRQGIWVSLDTNGTLLYRDRCDELVDANLNRLRVLLDGRDRQHEGEALSVGKPMDLLGPILENLAGVSAARRVARSDLRVSIVYIVDENNLKILPDIVMLLGTIFVPEVQVVSTLDGRTTAPVFKEARATAEEYCVTLDFVRPKPNTDPYLTTLGYIRDPRREVTN